MGEEASQSRLQPFFDQTTNESSEQMQSRQPSPYTVQIPQQHAMEVERMSLHSFGSTHMPSPSSMNMGGMVNSLPDYQTSNYGQQHHQQGFAPAGMANSTMLYGMQQGNQYANQPMSNINIGLHQQYTTSYQQAQQPRPAVHAYGSMLNVHPAQHQSPNPSYYHQQPMQVPPTGYAHSGQPLQGVQNVYHPYGQGYTGRMGTGFPSGQSRPDAGLQYPQGAQNVQENLGTGAYPPGGTTHLQPGIQGISRHSSDSSLGMGPSVPRGPPRKPKQSGHALWVGNLPPGTNVMDLKEHFSKDATKDIESVFLISKSNCAFVNYKTEASCAAAMTRFHDSRFQGVRLVCRLRKGAGAAPSGTPSGPSASTTAVDEPGPSTTGAVEAAGDSLTSKENPLGTDPASTEPGVKAKEKYFIVKSLTTEDLELSVRTGIWATQAHNEAALNKAFEGAENVYLIFSANKSGEYFGYARMTSNIKEEAASISELPSHATLSISNTPDLPSTIPTPATSFAPKGKIIDDSARGTIFWEADPDSDTEHPTGNRSGDTDDELTAPNMSQSFGKPFSIAWISTDRLPFYRTRGLRNPWNANREVKIARDGTELEPSVGRRLTSMFHRPQMGSTSPNTARGPVAVPIGGPHIAIGYVPQPSAGRPY